MRWLLLGEIRAQVELDACEVLSRLEARNGRFKSSPLTFQLSNDFQVKRVLKDYMPQDKRSGGYATLLEWTNIYYDENPEKKPFQRQKKRVRVGAVQWQMRPTRSLEALVEQVEFFVAAGKWELTLFYRIPVSVMRHYQNDPDTQTAGGEVLQEQIDAVDRDEARYKFSKLALKRNMLVPPAVEGIMATRCAEYEARSA